MCKQVIIILLVLVTKVSADTTRNNNLCFDFKQSFCEPNTKFYSILGSTMDHYDFSGKDDFEKFMVERKKYLANSVDEHFDHLAYIMDSALGEPLINYDYIHLYEPAGAVRLFGQTPFLIKTEDYRGLDIGCCHSSGVSFYFDALDLRVNERFDRFSQIYLCNFDTIQKYDFVSDHKWLFNKFKTLNSETIPTRSLRIKCNKRTAFLHAGD